jgi:hypothetical protein
MNFIRLSQLPAWLEGEFSKDLRENIGEDETAEDCLIFHPLKLDCVFNGLYDLLKMIDTYIYMQLPKFPREFYDFARCNGYLKRVLFQLEFGNGPLIHFFELTKTPEYAAIKICIAHPEPYELLKAAIKQNQMGIIRYLLEDVGYHPEIELLLTTVRCGHIHILEYIFSVFPEKQQLFKWGIEAPRIAVKKGNLTMLSYLKKIGLNMKDLLKVAMDNHKESCAVYLIKNGCKIYSSALETACIMNSLELVKLIVESGEIFEIASSTLILNYAIRTGRLEIARYLYERGNKPDYLTLMYIPYCPTPECARFSEEICSAKLSKMFN